MRNIKAIISAIIIVSLMIFNTQISYAMEIPNEESVEVETFEDYGIANATKISDSEYTVNGRKTTETVYMQPDGTIITDTFTVGTNMLKSPKGSDTATRTRTISGWGSITLTASFSWYTEGIFSYVKCSSMSATKTLSSGVVASTWETSRTSDYVSIGSAKAQVTYYFYNSAVPYQHQDGTFKITCTDNGTISDNGN